MTRRRLALVPRPAEPAQRAHDLPPLWDGHPVQWREWRTERPAHVCTVDDAGESSAEAPACTRCGALEAWEQTASGRVLDSIIGPSGRHRPGAPLAYLVVSRCGHCGQDQVTDLATGETWDLTDTDYTDTGSREEA